MKRDVLIFAGSDLHCGHDSGLTPPSFNTKPGDDFPSRHHKLHIIRTKLWEWFAAELKRLGRPDIAIWNGDLVDGSGLKSGGTEDLELPIQVKMAAKTIQIVGASENHLVRGTGYHVGSTTTTLEDEVFNEIKQSKLDDIGDEGHYDIRGLIINAKHEMGQSRSPVSQFTGLSTEMLLQMLWAEEKQQPQANLLLRAHIHRCGSVAKPSLNRAAWSMPALQGLGSVYGARKKAGLPVHFGFLEIRVKSREDWLVIAHLAPMELQKAHVVLIKK